MLWNWVGHTQLAAMPQTRWVPLLVKALDAMPSIDPAVGELTADEYRESAAVRFGSQEQGFDNNGGSGDDFSPPALHAALRRLQRQPPRKMTCSPPPRPPPRLQPPPRPARSRGRQPPAPL